MQKSRKGSFPVLKETMNKILPIVIFVGALLILMKPKSTQSNTTTQPGPIPINPNPSGNDIYYNPNPNTANYNANTNLQDESVIVTPSSPYNNYLLQSTGGFVY